MKYEFRRHLISRPRTVTLSALVAAGLLTGAPVARAARADTWTGEGSSGDWSDAGNWGGTTPGNGDTLNFGALSCGCYSTTDDINSLTVSGLSIAGNLPYQLKSTDHQLTLRPPSGEDGIDVAPAATAPGSTPVSPVIAVPLVLGDRQHWTVDGGGSLSVGVVSGGSNTLGVTLGQGGELYLDNQVDSGGIAVTGADPGQGPAANGVLGLLGDVDTGSSDGPIDVDDAGLQLGSFYGPAQTGPLAARDSAVTLGTVGPGGPGRTLVDGPFSVDGQSSTTVMLRGTGQTAGVDYGQLTATGDIALGGSLSLLDEAGITATCPTFSPGSVDTFLHTTGGSISGQFSNLPDGGLTSITAYCNGGRTRYPVRINYTSNSVTGTFVSASTTSTSLAASSAAIASGDSVTFTATVSPPAPASPEPSGTVQFLDGSTPIACAGGGAVNGADPDTATCTTSGLSTGDHTITAVYGGDGAFAGSASNSVAVAVAPATSGGSTASSGGSTASSGGSTASGGSTTGDSAGGPGSGTSRIVTASVTAGTNAVRVKVSCARTGASCTTLLRLIMTEKVRHHGHVGHRSVVLGATKMKLGAGHARVSAVKLNATGRRMLTRDRMLHAKLVLQQSVHGHLLTLSSRRVTLWAAHRPPSGRP